MICRRGLSVLLGVVSAMGLPACQDDVLILPPGNVSGQICNPITGRPEAGATMSISFDDGGAPTTKEIVTDEDGLFELEGIASGPQTLVLTSPAFNAEYAVEVTTGQTLPFIDPACRDPATAPGEGKIGGQICNRHTGEVVKDATITVILADDTVLTAQTDPATGSFEMDVPAGTIAVSVSSPGYSKSYIVEVVDGEVTVVEQSTDCAIPDPLSTGFIVGRVCAPGTADQPLVGARVTARYTGSDGSSYVETPVFTLEDGSFIIDPIGPTRATNVVVRAQKDDFAFTWNVPFVASRVDDPDGVNVTAGVACEPLVPDDSRRYLVVEGQYDRIQDVLSRMELSNVTLHDGIPSTLFWAEELFSTRDYINEFDVVFVNCGVEEIEFAQRLSPNALTNLRKYVEQGGSLYVSDWAYELVEQAFPDKINFINDDLEHDAAQVAIGGAYPTRVIDEGLQAVVGTSFEIDFAFQLGTVITEVAPDVTIYLEADMSFRRKVGGEFIADRLTNTPVTVGFKHGLGKVIYTSFHQEADEALDGPEDAVLRYLVFEL